jgi:hypothetical protein
MAVATLEDLQGALDVVVFPKVFEETGPTWSEDAILLVAGRVDHKGDETVLLADTVWTWEQSQALGPEAFRQAVVAGDRVRRGGRNGGPAWRNGNGTPNGSGHANGNGTGNGSGHAAGDANGSGGGSRRPAGVLVAAPPADPRASEIRRTVPKVSPLRGGVVEGTLEVIIADARPSPGRSPAASGEPPRSAPGAVMAPSEPSSVYALAPDGGDDPPWPDEALARLSAQDSATTLPVEASPGQVFHVRFRSAPAELVVQALETLRDIFRVRPGNTAVVLHLRDGGGHEREMRLPREIAYDAELLADVRRRLGEDLVELTVA